MVGLKERRRCRWLKRDTEAATTYLNHLALDRRTFQVPVAIERAIARQNRLVTNSEGVVPLRQARRVEAQNITAEDVTSPHSSRKRRESEAFSFEPRERPLL